MKDERIGHLLIDSVFNNYRDVNIGSYATVNNYYSGLPEDSLVKVLSLHHMGYLNKKYYTCIIDHIPYDEDDDGYSDYCYDYDYYEYDEDNYTDYFINNYLYGNPRIVICENDLNVSFSPDVLDFEYLYLVVPKEPWIKHQSNWGLKNLFRKFTTL